jgi:hypothetical protein
MMTATFARESYWNAAVRSWFDCWIRQNLPGDARRELVRLYRESRRQHSA